MPRLSSQNARESNAFRHASTCAANASLISTRSMRAIVRPPARRRAIGDARTGPDPHPLRIAPGEPPRPDLSPSPASPSVRALSPDASTSATAPSVICEEFPAVTVPNCRSKMRFQLSLAPRASDSRGCRCPAPPSLRTSEGWAPGSPRPASALVPRRGGELVASHREGVLIFARRSRTRGPALRRSGPC